MIDAADAEDRLVREIDVVLSSPSPQYHLMQYPGHFVNPIRQPPLSVRAKPRHHILEAEHVVNKDHTRIYQSQTIPINTHLCFGRLLLDETTSKEVFHLIPISQISQMRPTFHHLLTNDEDDEDNDRMDVTREYRTRQESIIDDHLSPVPSATNITFHRKESDRAVAARKSSFAYQHASQENEPWIQYRVVEPTMHRMPPQISNPTVFSPRKSYVQALNYISTKGTSVDAPYAANATSAMDASRSHRDVAQKLFQALQFGGPVPFSILQLALEESAAATPFMEKTTECSTTKFPWDVLNVMAVVVRGNWYLHSKFLHPSPCLSVSDNRSFQHVRTFLMLLLQDYGRIHRAPLQKVVERMKSPPWTSEHIRSLLRQIADPPSSALPCWTSKMADDTIFLRQYPYIEKLHDTFWIKQRLRFASELQLYSDLISS